MLWIAVSLFFVWCAYREVRGSVVPRPGFDRTTPVYKPYLVATLILAVVFGWIPVHTWYLEYFLSEKATELAEGHRAHVHCNTVFDTMLDPAMLAAGHADPRTGKIGIQHPWCDRLSSYMRHPQRASEEELWSLGIITHESMHVRGEMDEAKTECQAVQRNYRAAKLLGVADDVARQNALDYYNILYKRRHDIGGLTGSYYSDQCAPGKAMDEHLEDSTWY
jgi:hypothetical protein